MTLLICRTCPRYDVPATGEFRRALDAQIAHNPAADPNLVRHVQCLTGCPDDGVAALDGPGKARVRFTRLTPDHADALIKATHAHHASPTGAPDDWEIPAELVDTSATSPTNEHPCPRRHQHARTPRSSGEGEPPELPDYW